ncbi:MAG: UDP-N-acetyl-D-mannosamine dehydrogenase [Candidatus Wallbacteria bacterium HGW-Wallbacteria-1]|jgi:UDP-N-acetyl-D-mannosaminuronic acid dehydrogenase|uniref:UDP-N-acetyl-D-mannosamine dehydrogenase n=1 Tax=Candidatus Wallbacteria bacterium HGW-Wallbacteria-1 TaxID=2013854 RepID=A0A2N1PP43_9BACT|nr:MAG: UDP-N-acetyl-D-mannosamine dehydrogenase [Candidatus Wallbacteria bacterium HGW-Wallbacteria-1]
MIHSVSPVSVIGLGYIGLPTAAVIANRGLEVIGVDVSRHAVDTINQGRTHILEPDLDILVQAAVGSGKLRAVSSPEPAQAFLIAVPTPVRENRTPDLSMVMAAAESVAAVLQKGNVVILESTSPVGTTEAVSRRMAEVRPDLTFPHDHGEESDVFVAYCPERVLPGRVLHELVENDRVIGGISVASTEAAMQVYRIFVQGNLISTDSRTAEMTKLTENSFRDVNIAFANELSMICDKLDINVWELIDLANRHPRVRILKPGPGVGGHCIAVDPWFIVDSCPDLARIIRTAREVNLHKTHHIIDRITKIADRFREPVVACLGLSFKPDIDDLRESPAVEIVTALVKSGIRVLAVEPHISALPAALESLFSSGKIDSEMLQLMNHQQAIEMADIIVALVPHKCFAAIQGPVLDGKAIIDACGLWR